MQKRYFLWLYLMLLIACNLTSRNTTDLNTPQYQHDKWETESTTGEPLIPVSTGISTPTGLPYKKTPDGLCGALLLNGSPTSSVNFFFLAEAISEKEIFLDQVAAFTGLDVEDPLTLLQFIPYGEFRSDYNFFYQFVPDQDYGCADSASAIPGDQRFCFNLDVALNSLTDQCGDYAYEIDYLVIFSNNPFTASADSYTLEEIEPRTRIVRI